MSDWGLIACQCSDAYLSALNGCKPASRLTEQRLKALRAIAELRGACVAGPRIRRDMVVVLIGASFGRGCGC